MIFQKIIHLSSISRISNAKIFKKIAFKCKKNTLVWILISIRFQVVSWANAVSRLDELALIFIILFHHKQKHTSDFSSEFPPPSRIFTLLHFISFSEFVFKEHQIDRLDHSNAIERRFITCAVDSNSSEIPPRFNRWRTAHDVNSRYFDELFFSEKKKWICTGSIDNYSFNTNVIVQVWILVTQKNSGMTSVRVSYYQLRVAFEIFPQDVSLPLKKQKFKNYDFWEKHKLKNSYRDQLHTSRVVS